MIEGAVRSISALISNRKALERSEQRAFECRIPRERRGKVKKKKLLLPRHPLPTIHFYTDNNNNYFSTGATRLLVRQGTNMICLQDKKKSCHIFYQLFVLRTLNRKERKKHSTEKYVLIISSKDRLIVSKESPKGFI